MKRRIILVLTIMVILGGAVGGVYWWRHRGQRTTLLIRAEMALDQAQEPKRAVELAESFIRQQPADWRGYYVLARALSQLGQHERARQELQKGLKLNLGEVATLKLVLAMSQTYCVEASGVQDASSSQQATARALELLDQAGRALSQHEFAEPASRLDIRQSLGLSYVQACQVHQGRLDWLADKRELAIKVDDAELAQDCQRQTDLHRQQLETVRTQALKTILELVCEDPKRDDAGQKLLATCLVNQWQEPLAEMYKATVKLNDPPPITSAKLAIWRMGKAGITRQSVEQTRKYIAERQLQHPDLADLKLEQLNLSLALVALPISAQERQAELDKALEDCEAILKGKKLPKHIEPMVKLMKAKMLLAKNLPAQAEQDLLTLNTKYPGFVEAQFTYAQAANMLGKRKVAAEAMRKITTQIPLHAQARKYLAEQLLAEGHFNNAFEDATFFYRARPNDPEALALYVLTALRTEQPNLAQQVLKKAAADGKDDPVMLMQVSRCYKEMKEEQLSRQAAQAAAQCSPANLAQRVAVAQALRESNKLAEAEAMLTAAVAEEPLAREPLLELANLYLGSRRAIQAIECCKKLLEVDDHNVAGRRLLADGYYALGMLDEALVQCEELLRQEPSAAPIQVMADQIREMLGQAVNPQQSVGQLDAQHRSALPLAQINAQLKLGKPAKALEICVAQLKEKPSDVQMLLLAASACRTMDRFDECIKYLSAALDEQPDSLPHYYRLATQWSREGNIDAVAAKFASVRRARRELADLAVGWLYERTGEFAKAEQCYQRAAAATGATQEIREQALLNAARAAGAGGDLPRALAELDKLAASPDLQKRALLEKARLLIWQRKLAEADAPLATLKSLAGQQKDEALLRQVASLHTACRQYDEALAVCGELEKMRPDAPEPLMLHGQVLVQAGKGEQAAEFFRKAVQLQPGNYRLWESLIETLAKNGDAGAAMGALAELEKQGGSAKAFVALQRGAIFERWGMPAQAVEAYKQLDAGMLEIPRMALLLGKAHLSLGRLSEARQQLENVPAHAPEYVSARLILADMAEKPQDKLAELAKLTALRPNDPNLLMQVMNVLIRDKLPAEALKAFASFADKRAKDAPLPAPLAGLAMTAALASKEYRTAADLAARLAKEPDLTQYRHLAVLLMLDDRPDQAAALLGEPANAGFLDCLNGILLAARKGQAGAESAKAWGQQIKAIQALLAKIESTPPQEPATGPASQPRRLDPVMRLLAWTAIGATQDAKDVAAEIKGSGKADMPMVDSLLKSPQAQQEAQRLLEAMLYLELGATERAQTQALKLLQDSPTCAGAALIATSSFDAETAKKVLGLLQPADSVQAQTLRAELLMQEGQFAQAAQVYDALISKGQTGPVALLRQGVALEQSGQQAEALKVYRKLWEMTKSPKAANNVAYLLTQLSPKDKAALDEAARLVQTAMEATGGSAELRDTAGWVAYLQGRPAEACRHLTAAVEVMPDVPDVHYHLGAALAANGQKDVAKLHLEAAVRLAKQATPATPVTENLIKQAQEALGKL